MFLVIQLLDLIDTLWNVKLYMQGISNEDGMDLIDTLWNVKYYYSSQNKKGGNDLIDTLWNVKIKVSTFVISAVGI